MMTTETAPDLTDLINTLGEIRRKLEHYPHYCEALLRAQTGLERLKKAADPDCDDCQGSGLYGEDCICLCVNAAYHKAKADASYNRGYREAYNSGLKALADFGVEVSTLAMSVQEQLDLVKESAAGVVDIVEGRASSATSLLDVDIPDEPGSAELHFFPANGTRKGGGDDAD